ncbi:hypothetical protein B0A48_12328 [Cryoendolithus antarcticus]|uniref:NAD-dependent epimerase/dehydratase domain-containing protein n=1 Tax=Cryoendolithus antarcticus TaxID=1507870 RepID=A0A1V8SRP5_9PEZI|nr:hypothetical protein B0A48_12328 [Cryoendolithus antarcticus]
MTTTIPKGSTVLVTGVSGYIGSHVAAQLLEAGYRVRGTSRSKAKAQDLIDYFTSKYGADSITVAEVPDMVATNAYDEAVKGVSGIVHLSSVLTFSTDPEEVIPPSVSGALNILSAAMQEPGVKSLVVTSSSTAALLPQPNEKIKVKVDTWNDAALEAAYKPGVDGFTVYAASKTQAERELWKAIAKEKPHFQVATVLPNANFGTRFKVGGNSTGDWVMALAEGKDDPLQFPPQWFINVDDDAKLHVAALLDSEAAGKRLFAFAAPFTWNDVLAILRKLEPGKKLVGDRDMGEDLSEVPNGEAEALLKKHYGHGWTGLEETIKQNAGPVLIQ